VTAPTMGRKRPMTSHHPESGEPGRPMLSIVGQTSSRKEGKGTMPMSATSIDITKRELATR